MTRSPAQIFALVIGAVLVAAGVIGFFVNASFSTGGDLVQERDTLLFFDVNGWHNIVHLASGAVGLALAGSYAGARAYALGLAAVYVVVTIWGFVVGDNSAILGLVVINTEDNFLHLAIAVAGIAAGLATPAQPAPTTAAT